MKNLLLILALGMMAMSLTLSVEARQVLKRIDVEMTKDSAVAMALETYDGEFFDLAEFSKMKKYKGNVKAIMDKPTLTLENGEEIAVNGIRYFFVAKNKNKVKMPEFKLPPPEKRPSDEH